MSDRGAMRLRQAGLWGAAALVAGFALVLRFDHGLQGPMALDETWTGMIAAQTSLGGLVRQVRDDANAPLYYLFVWAWSQLAGASNAALRAPNLLFALATAGMALSCRGSLGGRTAGLWAILLCLWWPAIEFSAAARCYMLLFAVCAASTIAHVELMRRPDLKRAFVWAVAGAAAILTHYYAAALILAQVGALVWARRQRLASLWPAAAAFAPVAAWGLYHLPRLEQFARPGVAWYPLLHARDIPEILSFLCGGPIALAAIGVLLLLAVRSHRAPRDGSSAAVAWTVAASVAGVLLCVAAGAMRPTFTVRYLTPFAPGLLLALARLSDLASRRTPLGLILLPLAFGVVDLRLAPDPAPFGFETASAWLAGTRPRRVAFFWDHPALAIESPDQLRQVGGFFLRRSGVPAAVDAIVPGPGDDPSSMLADAARRGSAVLWVYDLNLQASAARRHPPEDLERALAGRCRRFGAQDRGVLACRPT